MNDIVRVREQLQNLANVPGVTDVQQLLAILEGLREAGGIALRVMEAHGGDLAMFREALVELRELLEPLRTAIKSCEKRVWELRISGPMPTEAFELLVRLVRCYERDVDDLLWCLPMHRRGSRA